MVSLRLYKTKTECNVVIINICFVQQVDRISKQMQLEQQLADAKLTKLKLEMSAERETLLKEKQQLLLVSEVVNVNF